MQDLCDAEHVEVSSSHKMMAQKYIRPNSTFNISSERCLLPTTSIGSEFKNSYDVEPYAL